MQPVDVVVDDAALRLDKLLQRSKQLEHLASGTGELLLMWKCGLCNAQKCNLIILKANKKKRGVVL